MSKGDFISKYEATILQGVGVMFMVYHHLFGFPERIAMPYKMLLDFSFLHIGTMLSYYGRICIAFFAFVSGYGMCKKGYQKLLGKPNVLLNGFKLSLHQLKKFYSRLWPICAVFIPLGYILGVYSFDFWILLKSLLGQSCAYNKEWWYADTYVCFILSFPVLFWVITLIERLGYWKSRIILITVGICGTMGYFLFNWAEHWRVFFCFYSGMLVMALEVFEHLSSCIGKLGVWKYPLAVLGIGGVSLTRIVFGHNCDEDFIFVPAFIFFLMILLKADACQRTINIVLGGIIGKYSTYIWLVHTFFAYYYFQTVTFAPYYSAFIFAWCLILCIIVGYVLEKILSIMRKKEEL